MQKTKHDTNAFGRWIKESGQPEFHKHCTIRTSTWQASAAHTSAEANGIIILAITALQEAERGLARDFWLDKKQTWEHIKDVITKAQSWQKRGGV